MKDDLMCEALRLRSKLSSYQMKIHSIVISCTEKLCTASVPLLTDFFQAAEAEFKRLGKMTQENMSEDEKSRYEELKMLFPDPAALDEDSQDKEGALPAPLSDAEKTNIQENMLKALPKLKEQSEKVFRDLHPLVAKINDLLAKCEMPIFDQSDISDIAVPECTVNDPDPLGDDWDYVADQLDEFRDKLISVVDRLHERLDPFFGTD